MMTEIRINPAQKDILIAGAGYIGKALAIDYLKKDRNVVVLDRIDPKIDGVQWIQVDFLTDEFLINADHVFFLAGITPFSTRWPWVLVLENVVTTARLLHSLKQTTISYVSLTNVESLTKMPALNSISKRIIDLALRPCPPFIMASLCRELAELCPEDPFRIAKAAQKFIFRQCVSPDKLRTIEVPCVGRRDLNYSGEYAGEYVDMVEVIAALSDFESLDNSMSKKATFLRPKIRLRDHHQEKAVDLYDKSLQMHLPVIIPPRPAFPDEVAQRQQESLWNGALINGNKWSKELQKKMEKYLEISETQQLLLTISGTEALKIAIVAAVGPAAPGDIAILPSFTFPATAEVLIQLGYQLFFCDVDIATWTLDPISVQAALEQESKIKLVVCVDTFGCPCEYEKLISVCNKKGVPLVADSAAGIGSIYRRKPVGSQSKYHAFSMSFAKVMSSGGAGGIAVIPKGAIGKIEAGWTRAALMNEINAIAALDQFEIIHELVKRRREVANEYQQLSARSRHLISQVITDGTESSYVHWVMRVTSHRESLVKKLGEQGIQTKDYFRALHLSGWPWSGRLPITEKLHKEVLALPMSSEITVSQAKAVVNICMGILEKLLQGTS